MDLMPSLMPQMDSTVIPLDGWTPGGVLEMPGEMPPPATDEGIDEIEKCLCDDVAERFKDSAELMRPFHQRWNENLQLDRGETLRESVTDGLSDLGIQIIRRAVTTWLKAQHEGLIADYDFCEFSPSSPLPIDEISATMMTRLCQHQARQQGLDMELTNRTLYDYDVLGTAVVAVHWDRREGMRVASRDVLQPIADPMTGMPTGEFEEIEEEVHETYQIHSRPVVETLSLFSVYPSHVDVEKLEDCESVIVTKVVSFEELNSKRRRELRVNRNGQYVRRMAGIYQNVEKLDPAEMRDQPRHGAGTDIGSTEVPEAGSKDKARGFQHKGCNIRLDLGCFLRTKRMAETGEGGGGTKAEKYNAPAIMGFLKKWKLTPEDLEPGGWWIVETINDKTLVRIKRQPFPFDRLNLLNAQFLIRRGCLWGDGLYDLAKGPALALNAIMSSGTDAARMIVEPEYVYDEQMFSDQRTTIKRLFGDRFVPGRGIPVRGLMGSPITNLIQPFHPDPQAITVMMQMQEALVTLIDRLLGTNVDTPGGGVGPRATATEVNTVTSQGFSFITWQNGRFESEIIEPALDMWAAMNKRNLTLPEAVNVLGSGTEAMPLLIRPEWLQGEIRAHAKGTTELTNRLVKSQAMANMLALLQPLGLIGMKGPNWARGIVRTGQLGDPQQLVPSDQEYMMSMNPLAGMMGGEPGQEGGGSEGGGQGGPGQIPVMRTDQDVEQKQMNA